MERKKEIKRKEYEYEYLITMSHVNHLDQHLKFLPWMVVSIDRGKGSECSVIWTLAILSRGLAFAFIIRIVCYKVTTVHVGR